MGRTAQAISRVRIDQLRGRVGLKSCRLGSPASLRQSLPVPTTTPASAART
jgi:hypothetical protein